MGLHFNAHGCSTALPRLRTLLYIAGANLLALHSAGTLAATYFDINLTSIHSRAGWKSKGRLVALMTTTSAWASPMRSAASSR